MNQSKKRKLPERKIEVKVVLMQDEMKMGFYVKDENLKK